MCKHTNKPTSKPTTLVEVIINILFGGWWTVWMYYRDNYKK